MFATPNFASLTQCLARLRTRPSSTNNAQAPRPSGATSCPVRLAGGEGGVVGRFDAVERLRASLMISVPGGKGSGQRPSALHLDRPGAQGVAPSKLSQMPFGERPRDRSPQPPDAPRRRGVSRKPRRRRARSVANRGCPARKALGSRSGPAPGAEGGCHGSS
jgi:hypothetical protein